MAKKKVEASQFSLSMTLVDLFRIYPSSVRVFVRNRLSCVGCSMAAFDTIKDVIREYALDQRKFMKELRDAIRS